MKIFVNGINKSGTNLLTRLLELSEFKYSRKSIALTNILGRYELIKKVIHGPEFESSPVPVGNEISVSVSSRWLNSNLASVKDREYATGHAAYSDHLRYILDKHDYLVLYILRHPGAMLNSLANFIVEDINSWYPLHSFIKSLSFHDRLKFFIEGGYVKEERIYYNGIRAVMKAQEGWLENKNAIVVRFEDLVGIKGGGNDSNQKAAIQKIFNSLEVDFSDIDSIQENLFGGSHTFRKGQISAWEQNFGGNLLNLLQEKLKDIKYLEEFGYM